MKALFVFCVVVISGLFLYEPAKDIRTTQHKEVNLISPELQECEMYKSKIEANLKQAKTIKQ